MWFPTLPLLTVALAALAARVGGLEQLIAELAKGTVHFCTYTVRQYTKK
jgi:hypothetical protein